MEAIFHQRIGNSVLSRGWADERHEGLPEAPLVASHELVEALVVVHSVLPARLKRETLLERECVTAEAKVPGYPLNPERHRPLCAQPNIAVMHAVTVNGGLVRSAADRSEEHLPPRLIVHDLVTRAFAPNRSIPGRDQAAKF